MTFSISQVLLASTIVISTYGTYIGLSPPNPPKKPPPSTGDTLRAAGIVTSRHFPKLSLSPFFILGLHTSLLALYYPNIPPWLLHPGSDTTPNYDQGDGLNANLITWSAATIIPLILVTGVGIPLRLGAYSTLGKNFTFTLAEPDTLVTGGMYRYVQHPSYVGILVLFFGNLALLARTDGAVVCWLWGIEGLREGWYGPVKAVYLLGIVVVSSVIMLGGWTRVKEEERMLKAKFGEEWVRWNKRTARFVPGVF
ncbi:isoprenylcysteine carboxyl methyltransferase [Rhypophila decipiens]|uniref:Protein-S-isoprenylcysteine O-methyltransferase n=1 Tax=Rhypophila decipiens TaxID=261697 RepID=A0AAN6XWV8_9PEZI|nr:isoprenylcysteine carboxyl methyltransferase [Rhypophila decipiens]